MFILTLCRNCCNSCVYLRNAPENEWLCYRYAMVCPHGTVGPRIGQFLSSMNTNDRKDGVLYPVYVDNLRKTFYTAYINVGLAYLRVRVVYKAWGISIKMS